VRAVLQSRSLLEDIQSEWYSDDAWLDRVVCGTLARVNANTDRKDEQYFGLLIVSSSAPMCQICPELSPKTEYEDNYLWPEWSQKHRELRVDRLHLIPLSGRAKAAGEPAESLDLGKLIRPPTLEADEGEEHEEGREAKGPMTLALDFGSSVAEFRIHGGK